MSTRGEERDYGQREKPGTLKDDFEEKWLILGRKPEKLHMAAIIGWNEGRGWSRAAHWEISAKALRMLDQWCSRLMCRTKLA